MSKVDLSWAVPVMRAGYAGRALVYLVVAGISLYSIWRGGQAQGTSSALGWLENTAGGGVLLFLIFVGMFAYAAWRFINAAYDLEEYGTDGKGIVARLGLTVSGIVHLGLGILAFSLLFGGGSSGGSSIPRYVGTLMQWPFGRWIVGIGGLVVIAAGAYYVHKGWSESYRKHLRANRFTMNWNWLLKAGVIAQGVVVAAVGLLFLYAALQADPSEAGGVDKAFSWLSQRAYGQALVTALCVGLLGFALFCAVNALYRVVPKVAGDDIQTVAMKLRARAPG